MSIEPTQDFGVKDEIAVEDELEGMELYCPQLWLEGEEDEDEAISDHGHVYLARNFRGSGDPAVLLSKTMLAAPELLEIVQGMVASMEEGLVALGWESIEQYRESRRTTEEKAGMDPYLKAVEIIKRLKGD